MDTWEKVVIGIAAIAFLVWFFPGVKTVMARSQDAPKDWKAVLIPIACVVLFIFFLISTL